MTDEFINGLAFVMLLVWAWLEIMEYRRSRRKLREALDRAEASEAERDLLLEQVRDIEQLSDRNAKHAAWLVNEIERIERENRNE